MKTLIVLVGPTGVGKTETSLNIAENYSIPIINADSRQIFSEIPIGTAAPTAEQQRRVKHFFVGNHSITDYYSASLYEEDVLQLLDTLFSQSDIAMMCGGSMMYIDAVCNGIDDIPTVDDDTRELMKRRLAEEGLPALVEELEVPCAVKVVRTLGHCGPQQPATRGTRARNLPLYGKDLLVVPHKHTEKKTVQHHKNWAHTATRTTIRPHKQARGADDGRRAAGGGTKGLSAARAQRP